MPSAPARSSRGVGLVPVLLVAVCAVAAVQVVNLSRTTGHQSRTSASAAAAFHRTPDRPPAVTTTTTTDPPTTTTTSTTVPPPAPATTTTTSPPPPASTPVAQASLAAAVPTRGQASVWGCAAAISYLSAYAYPGFSFECPGYALGREAMTCLNEQGVCPGEAVIAIADACPAAYMNEASNSWVLEGRSTAPIDPYGEC